MCTGITGSGKSSTLAAIVNQINQTKNKHIITIEDPIEYLIRDKKSIITQRELGVDTTNYKVALRSALRQDPDVILIGELRDRDTIETAISAAETGHLVISTLHTLDARETIYRILNVFETGMQSTIRMHLASVLKAVISQRLAKRSDRRGFVPACEIMIVSQRIREMIEDPERTVDIPKAIAESKTSYGMQTFDQSLIDLLNKGWIDLKHALELTNHPEDFKVLLSGIKMDSNNRFNNSEQNSRNLNYFNKETDANIEFDFTNAVPKNTKKKI
ncbi:MAG: type IV pilus twitching motility protein PilT [Bdellovibrionales bacterium]